MQSPIIGRREYIIDEEDTKNKEEEEEEEPPSTLKRALHKSLFFFDQQAEEEEKEEKEVARTPLKPVQPSSLVVKVAERKQLLAVSPGNAPDCKRKRVVGDGKGRGGGGKPGADETQTASRGFRSKRERGESRRSRKIQKRRGV